MQLSTNISQVPQSIYEVLQLYASALDTKLVQGNFDMTKTALLRYTVPAWGGPEPIGKRQIASDAIDFLKTLPVQSLNDAIQKQDQYFSQIGVDNDCQRRNRFYLKKLIDWANDQNWLNIYRPEEREVYRFNRPKGQGRQIVQNVRSTSLNRPKPNALGTFESDYIETEFGVVLANRILDEELRCLQAYVKRTTKSDRSTHRCLHYIKRILGWLHRQKNIPLEDLRLTQIIPFVQMKFSDKDFKDDPVFKRNKQNQYLSPEKVHEKLLMLEGMGLREAKEAATTAILQLDQYIEWWNSSHREFGKDEDVAPSSIRLCINALIHLAKYLYQTQTDVDEAMDFEDIPTIKRLKKKIRNTKLDPKRTEERIKERYISWPQAVQVFEKQRKRSNAYLKAAHNPRCKNNTAFRKRPVTSIATEMQRTVALGLMIFIPTDRQQTYRNLRQGSDRQATFKKGAFYGETFEEFTPVEKMKAPNDAMWWINLKDFKTDKTYGEFWYPVPNIEFADGKTFYQYIEGWLFGFEDHEGKWPTYYKGKDSQWQGYITPNGKRCGWREALCPLHELVFTKPRKKGEVLLDRDFCGLIKGIFIRFTQEEGDPIPVTPHSFRHMLATYLDSLDISHAEKESISYCMHHSLETHAGKYTHRENMRKIDPAVTLMNQLNKKLLRENHQSGLSNHP